MSGVRSWQRYFAEIEKIFGRIQSTQAENFEAAAAILAEAIEKDGLIHVFGVGHSTILGEEVKWRAATLAPIHAINELSMSGVVEITKSGRMENLLGAGEAMVEYHRINPPDAVIIASQSGNNIVPIEFAEACRARGVKVVAINSIEYTNFLNPRHPSGKKLKDHADVVIDNCCPIGDGVLTMDGLDQTVGPSSTAAGVPIINALLAQTVENLLEKGIKPDVYYNGSLAMNRPEVKEHNNALVDKYFYRIRNL